MDVVGECVAQLSGPAKDAFILRELEGNTTEEICEKLDVKPNYVWVLLHRARTQLQGCIEARWSREQAREEGGNA
jgi:RNA polymerase sigma-70 factor (ECF subfamily)